MELLQAIGSFASLIILYILLRYLPGYFGQKGKNLANKEDVQALTRLTEEVQHQFRLMIQHDAFQNQLRMVALERRLEVHQQAYTLWKRLIYVLSDPKKIRPIVEESRDWWDKNCMYLSPEPRKAFIHACSSAWIHADMAYEVDRKEIRENLEEIRKVGPLIVEAMQLPPLQDDTGQDLISKVRSELG